MGWVECDASHKNGNCCKVQQKSWWAASADQGRVFPSWAFSCCLIRHSFCSTDLRTFQQSFRTALEMEKLCYNKIMDVCVCVTWTGIIFLALTLRSTGATQSCPIEINPERMVIKYQGKSQNAICKPTLEGSANQEGAISWQVQQGIKTNSTSWSADTNKDWDARPVCMGTFKGKGTCQKHLDFTLYSMYC